jgi:hypothetical protein
MVLLHSVALISSKVENPTQYNKYCKVLSADDNYKLAQRQYRPLSAQDQLEISFYLGYQTELFHYF